MHGDHGWSASGGMLMCRMFGIVATMPQSIAPWMTDVEPSLRSLAIADKSGEANPDGWGIAWYNGEQDAPHVVKDPGPAYESLLFEQTAREVSACVALAHIRRSSGTSSVLANTHPFIAGRWAFCHNGHCSRERLMEHLLPKFRNGLEGENDSEVYFALLLQHLESETDPLDALRDAVHEVASVGDFTGLNFLLCDGRCMYAFHYSTDPERHSMYLQHQSGRELVASEPLGAASWEELPNGSLAVLTPAGHTLVSLV
ncbi:class II glutamine amidotransferase [Candidatus Cryosericum hinesii]|uniref:Class II glutamine amidotransferase n=2 Tax=Candidatus Cryosericum hinesii TaxID=2290915 RepID=A0A398DG56_9BACT|nr:class II glutamine amidotransferase [Candidatus Cryosericum hinesii]RIE12463.1 class II glutamine amidotransferase [Candidatus Cryosericum hinesii]RIE12659.1 class II glutamine amidotransferase [Candidatus Cryosericum hinesii]